MEKQWTHESIPDLKGKTAIVTGANTGLGFEITKHLSLNNAQVVMACRSKEKGAMAKEQLLKIHPKAKLDLMELDLSNFQSIENFSSAFRNNYKQLHILGNNAGGVNASRKETQDGLEYTVGVNFLGTAKLTSELFPLLMQTPESRIVNMSSSAERQFTPNFDDFLSEDDYEMMKAYALSKVSLLHFTYELNQRMRENGLHTIALAAHPGGAFTNAVIELRKKFKYRIMLKLAALFKLFQSKDMAALPFLRAASDPNAEGGTYYGPDGKNEGKGHPVKVSSSDLSYDKAKSRETWHRAAKYGAKFHF